MKLVFQGIRVVPVITLSFNLTFLTFLMGVLVVKMDFMISSLRGNLVKIKTARQLTLNLYFTLPYPLNSC